MSGRSPEFRVTARRVGVLGAALLVGCATTAPAASPGAALTPEPVPSPPAANSTAMATASPTDTPSATQQALGTDTIAEVVTTDLVVRTAPGVDHPSEILPGLLQPGDRLFVIEGPVHVTFYDWYHVQPIADRPPQPLDWPAAGWVAAASRDGEAWIAPRPADCPQSEDLEVAELAEFHPLEALACFGDRSIRVRASALICPGYVQTDPPRPNYTIDPGWLGSGQGCALHTADGMTVYGASAPFFAPEVRYGESSWQWFVGQFDHPAASSCVLQHQSGDPQMPSAPDLDSEQVVLVCRSHLAVIAVEPAEPLRE